MEREKLYVPDLSDKFWYGFFPSLVYATLIGSSAVIFADAKMGAYIVAAATLVILIFAIRNAWDLVTAIVKALAKKQAPIVPAKKEPPVTAALSFPTGERMDYFTITHFQPHNRHAPR